MKNTASLKDLEKMETIARERGWEVKREDVEICGRKVCEIVQLISPHNMVTNTWATITARISTSGARRSVKVTTNASWMKSTQSKAGRWHAFYVLNYIKA